MSLSPRWMPLLTLLARLGLLEECKHRPGPLIRLETWAEVAAVVALFGVIRGGRA